MVCVACARTNTVFILNVGGQPEIEGGVYKQKLMKRKTRKKTDKTLERINFLNVINFYKKK